MCKKYTYVYLYAYYVDILAALPQWATYFVFYKHGDIQKCKSKVETNYTN